MGAPIIQTFNPTDRHAQTTNWGVTQDKRGVMYFANAGGVLEFDGTSWRLIELPLETYVRSLAVDEAGTVYVGATNDFGYLASDDAGRLVYRSLLNRIPEKQAPFHDIWSTHAVSHGVYFVADDRIFRLTEGRIEVIPCPRGNNGFVIAST